MHVDEKLKVVLCWHMHQPEYRNAETNEYLLPWTYLHGTKDYIDMAAHIDNTEGAKAVINFAPTLLEQLDDYANQVGDFIKEQRPLRDPLLATLVAIKMPVEFEKRRTIIKNCLKANKERLISRFHAFHRLYNYSHMIFRDQPAIQYVNDQFLADIVTWYHLSWLGETTRRENKTVKELMDKEFGYTLEDRYKLLEVIEESLSSVISTYKKLAEEGKIELSVTPYAHPIIPLLLDIQSTKEAMPDAEMPELKNYPGGRERTLWHIEEGLKVFENHFGFRPKGCWPSEGAISTETLDILSNAEFEWAATGQAVLSNTNNTLNALNAEHDNSVHTAYQVNGNAIHQFFRDDGLSDLIGFTYSKWHADDAISDFINHLSNINEVTKGMKNRVVSIILDGENAWEYYPENGYYFLKALYENLANHPELELTTFSECIKGFKDVKQLPSVVAGSWVYGTFSTWIGDKAKNRGWDMLGDAKKAFDEVVSSGKLAGEQLDKAEHQLAICEGSDWFWWFGDYNPSDSVKDFELLFRTHLKQLYQLMDINPPEYLQHSFTQGGGDMAHGGVMRKST